MYIFYIQLAMSIVFSSSSDSCIHMNVHLLYTTCHVHGFFSHVFMNYVHLLHTTNFAIVPKGEVTSQRHGDNDDASSVQ
jgi:hypothetical protein